MTRDEVTGVIAYLAAAFPRADFPEATVRVWLVELEGEDAPDGIAMVAARRCARTLRFPPALADYLTELKAARKERLRRLSIEASKRALPPGDDERVPPFSDPVNWDAFVAAARREAARLGKPAPQLPDKPPPGVTLNRIIDEMHRPPEIDAPEPAPQEAGP